MKNKLNKNGFSMVELLAVIVILGVISTVGIVAVSKLVDRSREHYYDSQNQNFVMAAKAYANDNRNVLPKEIGGVNKIYLKELMDKKYITDEIVDQNKRKCDLDKSYVSIFKKNKTDYSYIGYLNCPSCASKGNEEGYCQTDSNEKPVADISLSIGKMTVSEGGEEEQIKMAKGTLTMKGNSAGNKLLYSFSYKIYRDGVMKYNSGTKRLNAYTKTISIDNYLSNNVPGTLKVILTVTNEDGYSKTVSSSKNYKDVVSPHCGTVTGQGKTKVVNGITMCDKSEWINSSRDVWVLCRDYQGSGCKQHEFSGHFTRESGEYGRDIIKVQDISGQETECTVYTCIDKTSPTITIDVYKRNSDGEAEGDALKRYTSNTNDTTIKDLTTDIGWFNSNYPNGVYFDVTLTDTVLLDSYKVEKNESFNYGSIPDEDKFKEVSIDKNMDDNPKFFENALRIHTYAYLYDEGTRYVRFTAKDGKGNISSISFEVQIDRTAPELKVTAGRCSHRTDSECKNDSFVANTSSTVTADNSHKTQTIDMKDWVSKGIRIDYEIKDKNKITRLWETEKKYSMVNEGDITKGKDSNTVESTNSTVTLDGKVSLASVGKRQGVITATDSAGNSTKVIINGYVANRCTVTYSSNGGTFNSGTSDTTQTVDYNSYFGDATNGMRNALGGHYNATRDYYYIDAATAWKAGTTTFNQDNRYKAQEVCSGMADEANRASNTTDKTVTLNVNWRPYKVNIKYNVNGGTLSSNRDLAYTVSSNGMVKYNGSEYVYSVNADSNLGENGLLNYNYTKGLNTTNSYHHVVAGKEWYKNSSLTGTAFNQDTNYKASEICDAKTADCNVTLYTGWKNNTCTINYLAGTDSEINNGAAFTKNTDKTTEVLYKDGHMGDWPKKNGMRNCRGKNGYYAAKYTDNVIQGKGEWYASIGGKFIYFDQAETYAVETLCPNLATEPNTNVDLRAKWLSKKPSLTLYTWKFVSSDCSKTDDVSNPTLDQRPRRDYKFAAYKCFCEYSDDDSSLTSAKAYYKRHTSWKDHKCNEINFWNEANDDQKKHCFPADATIFYQNTDNGVKACNMEGNYNNNEYVYQVCENGKVWEKKNAKPKDPGGSEEEAKRIWYHGSYWYWGSGKYRAHLDYILTSKNYFRREYFNMYDKIDNDTKPDSSTYNGNFNYGGSKNQIQNACKNYCEYIFDNPRYTAKDPDNIDYADEEYE